MCVAHTSRVADDSCYKLWQVILLRVLKKKINKATGYQKRRKLNFMQEILKEDID